MKSSAKLGSPGTPVASEGSGMSTEAILGGPAGASKTALWRRLLPFVLALALLGVVLLRLDLPSLGVALASAPLFKLLAFTAVWNVGLLVADAWATAWVYRRSVCEVRFSELFVLRGASYLPSLLNHHVGQAWLTYFLARVHNAELWRMAGATFIVYATTFGCLLGIGLLSLPFNPDSLSWLGPIAALVLIAGGFYLAFIGWKPSKLRSWPLLAPAFQLGVRGHLVALAVRLPHLAVLFVGVWLPLHWFGVAIPLADALVVVPPVVLVSALPVTPQGVGTRDALAVFLFQKFAAPGIDAEAQIAAATLSWAVALTAVQLLSSPFLMRRAYRLLGSKYSGGEA